MNSLRFSVDFYRGAAPVAYYHSFRMTAVPDSLKKLSPLLARAAETDMRGAQPIQRASLPHPIPRLFSRSVVS